MKKYLVILFASFLLLACNYKVQDTDLATTTQTEMTKVSSTPVDGHYAKIALDYNGVYTGKLLLNSVLQNVSIKVDENSYTLSSANHNNTGSLTWENGNTIILTDAAGASVKFFVGENRLFLLTNDNQRVIDKNNQPYVLTKQ